MSTLNLNSGIDGNYVNCCTQKRIKVEFFNFGGGLKKR